MAGAGGRFAVPAAWRGEGGAGAGVEICHPGTPKGDFGGVNTLKMLHRAAPRPLLFSLPPSVVTINLKENRKNWFSALRKLESERKNIPAPLDVDEAGGPHTGGGAWAFPAPPVFPPIIIRAVCAQDTPRL